MDTSPPPDPLTEDSLKTLFFNHQNRTPQQNTVAVMDLEEDILPGCIKQVKQRFTRKQSITEFIWQSTQAIVSCTTCIVFLYWMYYLLPWLCVKVPELLTWLYELFNPENFNILSQYATRKLNALFEAIGFFYSYIHVAIDSFQWPAWPTPSSLISWLYVYCPERFCPPDKPQEPNVIWNVILVILVLVLFLFLVNLSLFTFKQVKASMPGWPKWLSRTQASDSKKETKVSEPPKPWIWEATCTFIREAFSRTLYFLFTWTLKGWMIISKLKFDQETTTVDDRNEIAIMILQTVADEARTQRLLTDNSRVTYADWAERKQKAYDTLAPTGKSQLYDKLVYFIEKPPERVSDVLLQFILYNDLTFRKVLNSCISACSTARTESKSWNTRMVQGICAISLVVTAYVFVQPVSLLHTMEGPFNLGDHYNSSDCSSSSFFVTEDFANCWNNRSFIQTDCKTTYDSELAKRNRCYKDICENSWVPFLCETHYANKDTAQDQSYFKQCDTDNTVTETDECFRATLKQQINDHKKNFICNDQSISAERIVPMIGSFGLLVYLVLCVVVVVLWMIVQSIFKLTKV